MAEIKSLDKIREKWTRVTAQRGVDYAEGIAAPKRDWAKSTLAAAPAYVAGVQDAIARKAFDKGVATAGTGAWQARASSVGVDRWAPGVQAGAAKYETAFGPYRETIQSVALPPKYPRGDPRNYARVQAVGEALRKKKVGK